MLSIQEVKDRAKAAVAKAMEFDDKEEALAYIRKEAEAIKDEGIKLPTEDDMPVMTDIDSNVLGLWIIGMMFNPIKQ